MKFKATQSANGKIVRSEFITARDAVDAMGLFQEGFLSITHDADRTRAHMTNIDGRIVWEVVAI